MNKVEVGQEVQVANFGKIYPSYDKKFRELDFKNKHINNLPDDDERRRRNDIFKVFGVSHHCDTKILICAIEAEDGKQLLISADGLRDLPIELQIERLCKSEPNDLELGSKVRELVTKTI